MVSQSFSVLFVQVNLKRSERMNIRLIDALGEFPHSYMFSTAASSIRMNRLIISKLPFRAVEIKIFTSVSRSVSFKFSVDIISASGMGDNVEIGRSL